MKHVDGVQLMKTSPPLAKYLGKLVAKPAALVNPQNQIGRSHSSINAKEPDATHLVPLLDQHSPGTER
jgi:hypothetical protein